MNYSKFKNRFPDEVLVYIEEFGKNSKTVVFDFLDSNEFELFTSHAGFVYNVLSPSMVYLTNYKERTIQENTIYSIQKSTIEAWIADGQIAINEDSFLIGYLVTLNDTQDNIFLTSVSLNDEDDWNLNYYSFGGGNINEMPLSYKGSLSVTVRDVGQGNWNEIRVNGETRIVYDAGAPMLASQQHVRNIISNRPDEYSKTKPGLILSHWDKDHYHALIGMSDMELSNFSFFVCRGKLLNKTSRILFVRIREILGMENVYCLQAERRTSRGGPTILVPKNPTDRQITIFNAQENKNRNISGIVLSIRTQHSSVVLTGDAHYPQISRDVLPLLNYPNNHYLLVPHHGGKAGKYVYNLPSNVIPGDAIISVGKNNYKHPCQYYIDGLKNQHFKVLQTQDKNSDITIDL